MHTILESIATANPPFKLSKNQILTFSSKLEGMSPKLCDRAAKIYENSGIDHRYTCIQDYLTEPPNFSFYPNNWGLNPLPSTFDRNQLYQLYATKIAILAAQQAIEDAKLNSEHITHLIVVSCTGFSAPGLDVRLIQKLRLRNDVDRTMIGFMGCCAAFNGLKSAHAICQSNPNAKVLLVCVELCTLHFQNENSLETIVINAIFGDGAAAAILSSKSDHDANGKLAYVDGASALADDTSDLMSWTIGNTGFLMGLSPRVPDAIVQHLPNYLTQLLDRNNLTQSDLNFWAVHPGGRQIVDKIQELFRLEDSLMRDSYEILKQYGNMSSCTILFILKRLLSRHNGGEKLQNGLALAFGPGLTIEGCIFKQVVA